MRSLWSGAGEACVAVAVLIGLPLLASGLGWPLGEEASWMWLWQYLRGGTLPADVVLAVLVVLLWAVWAAYLAVVVLDVIAVLRGLVPRVGAVRLVWVLVTGGTTAASTHTAAVAAHTDTVAQAPAQPEPETQGEPSPEQHDQPEEVVERTRTLANFGFDSADLTPAMRDSLEPTLGMIGDLGLADTPVVVTGHADPVGDPTYNEGLSERRAQAVADHLAEHLHEDVDFEVGGMGSAQPPTDPDASYAEHRRVEIAYTLQAPRAEEPNAEGADEAAEETSEPVPEQVPLDATTTSDHSSPSSLLVSALAGAAGAGVGYAVGRRHAHAGSSRSEAKAPGRTSWPDEAEDTPTGAEHDTGSKSGGLVRSDPRGGEGGVLTADGYVLVGRRVRVHAREGIAFVGAHAAGVLAAVVHGHGGRGAVMATPAVVEALGGGDLLPSGVQIVADLPGARIAVEAALLRCARQIMDDEYATGEVSEPGGVPTLVVSTGHEVHDAREAHQVLNNSPGVVVGVLGEPAGPGAVVHCDHLEGARVASPQGGQAYAAGPLRHRDLPRRHSVSDKANPVAPELADHQPEPGSVPETEADPQPAADIEATDRALPAARVGVRLFAPRPVCEVDGNDVLTRSNSRLLLAMLALSPRGLPEGQLSEVLSPGRDEAKARKDRYNAITGLRTPLRDALKSQERILFKKNGRYFLQEELFDIDVVHTKDLSKRINSAFQGREEILRELLKVWEKPLLSDCEETWFESHRKHYADQFIEVLVLLAKETDAAESRISLLRKAMNLDRFNESIYQDAMRVYGGMVRPDAVRRTYRSLEKALGELKKKPSPASEQLLNELTSPDSLAQQ
ncbi:OmpA family protein [Nocardiopsis nanhaiensis]